MTTAIPGNYPDTIDALVASFEASRFLDPDDFDHTPNTAREVFLIASERMIDEHIEVLAAFDLTDADSLQQLGPLAELFRLLGTVSIATYDHWYECVLQAAIAATDASIGPEFAGFMLEANFRAILDYFMDPEAHATSGHEVEFVCVSGNVDRSTSIEVPPDASSLDANGDLLTPETADSPGEPFEFITATQRVWFRAVSERHAPATFTAAQSALALARWDASHSGDFDGSAKISELALDWAEDCIASAKSSGVDSELLAELEAQYLFMQAQHLMTLALLGSWKPMVRMAVESNLRSRLAQYLGHDEDITELTISLVDRAVGELGRDDPLSLRWTCC